MPRSTLGAVDCIRVKELRSFLSPFPSHASESAHAQVGEFLEGERREIKVRSAAARASVCDADSYRFTLVGRCDFLVAQRIVIRVGASVPRIIIEYLD